MSRQPCGHKIYCGNVGKVWVDGLMQRKTRVGRDERSLNVMGWLGVRPAYRSYTDNKRRQQKQTSVQEIQPRFSASSRHKHTPTQTHTELCTCALSLILAHSFVLLRIENNNNKSIIIPKPGLNIYFHCLSSPCLISHLIQLPLQPGAVQEEGQRSRLLFLQVTV